MSIQQAINFTAKPAGPGQVMISYRLMTPAQPGKTGYDLLLQRNQPAGGYCTLQRFTLPAGGNRGRLLLDLPVEAKYSHRIAIRLTGHGGDELVCAALELPTEGLREESLSSSAFAIRVPREGVGTDSLLAGLDLPGINQTAPLSCWVALFPGVPGPDVYFPADMLGFTRVKATGRTGKVLLGQLKENLSRFSTYTLVLGTGFNCSGNPDFNRLLCSHTFTVWKSCIYLGVSKCFAELFPVSHFQNINQP